MFHFHPTEVKTQLTLKNIGTAILHQTNNASNPVSFLQQWLAPEDSEEDARDPTMNSQPIKKISSYSEAVGGV